MYNSLSTVQSRATVRRMTVTVLLEISDEAHETLMAFCAVEEYTLAALVESYAELIASGLDELGSLREVFLNRARDLSKGVLPPGRHIVARYE